MFGRLPIGQENCLSMSPPCTAIGLHDRMSPASQSEVRTASSLVRDRAGASEEPLGPEGGRMTDQRIPGEEKIGRRRLMKGAGVAVAALAAETLSARPAFA